MDGAQCYIGLALLLGFLIGVFLADGNARRVNAARKISAYKVEQDKAKAIMDKARQNRQAGRMAMPGALFLMLLGILLALLTLYMLSSADWPF